MIKTDNTCCKSTERPWVQLLRLPRLPKTFEKSATVKRINTTKKKKNWSAFGNINHAVVDVDLKVTWPWSTPVLESCMTWHWPQWSSMTFLQVFGLDNQGLVSTTAAIDNYFNVFFSPNADIRPLTGIEIILINQVKKTHDHWIILNLLHTLHARSWLAN